ncbi:MAG: Nramp family divalent metal transporter [Acidimicrobiaceae bacterium]|nr:Nramp family divalent metal transporter [Acidimicrobiaceae bacterium]
MTGASDDDPSGIATYSQAGAQFGLALLWTALITLPLMAAVQEICDRTALATGTGLGELALKRFNRLGKYVIGVLIAALILANGLNIAADLVAIGSGMQLLHAGPTWIWALLAGVLVTLLLALGSFDRIATVFKLLCAVLLSYFVVAVIVTRNWLQVISYAFIPHFQFSSAYIGLLVAVLGTTISPYLFFWQSAHRIEDMRTDPEGGSKVQPLRLRSLGLARRKLATSRADVFTGMTFSNLVMFAIILSTSETLHAHNKTNIQSAAQAAASLMPFAGHFAGTIFALGFIGSGLLAVPILAASGAAGMAGLMHRPWGFSSSIRKAPIFYALVGLGTLGGTVFSLLNTNPIQLLVFVAAINGVAAAPFLIVVMLVSGNKKIMGKHSNHRLASTIGWSTTALMAAAAVAFFATGGLGF